MSSANPIRHISDTALWVAVYRAQESERAEAVFHDPYARKLAGDRGMQIAAAMPFAQRHSWSYIARTWLVDQVIEREVQQGTDTVINLAAGLDSRPYRMQLPASLRWIEVDLPDMLNYKQDVLAAERPVCAVERVPLDLRDTAARRALFHRLGGEVKRALMVSEGLIVYFEADGAAQFFAAYGWKVVETRSLLQTAAKLKRLSFGMRLLSLLPDPAGRKPDKPWGGVCVLENSGQAPTG